MPIVPRDPLGQRARPGELDAHLLGVGKPLAIGATVSDAGFVLTSRKPLR
ncbi:hypothetical protein [Gordonia rhizosphera]|nr:hypothetical protein [Gordonia rhizosphera]